MKPVRFEAELFEGHKRVVCAIVPFDPLLHWKKKPLRLAGRRHGWPVRGKLEGVDFHGYVGERWGKRFVMLDEAVRQKAGVRPGDTAALTLGASDDAEVIAAAIEQSKITTQPGKPRADAVPPPAVDRGGPLLRLRKACARWPGVIETTTFGHPTFQAGPKKTFAVLDDHERPGRLCLVVKLDKAEQARRLKDARFAPCKFGAKHGWTSMFVDGGTDWKLAAELLRASYRLVASKKLLAAAT